MGYTGYGTSGTIVHEHSALAGEGGVLSITATRINAFSPVGLVIGLS